MILKPTKSPEDWKELLAKPDLHWKPGRSAMETAYSWEAQKGLPPKLAAIFPANTRLLLAIPEFKVALPGGERASQNDVFALLSDPSGLTVCMIEAKRDEPFGPTLGDWAHNASKGKKQRLHALLDTLDLPMDAAKESQRYQLFHRTASAIITAKQYHATRAVMLVQSFSPEHRWFDDYTAFVQLFGIKANLDKLTNPVNIHGISLQFGWAVCPLKTETQ